MLINNIQEFAKCLPSTGGYNPNEYQGTYDAFKPFLEDAELWLETQLIGVDLFKLVANDEKLKGLASIVVACSGYYGGIPFNDLVQTPNGFGVVSNSNLTPASSDRVNRLLEWVNKRLSEAIDNLIIYVFSTQTLNTEWKKFDLYDYYTESIFITATSFSRHCRKGSLREHLEENHPMLMQYQHEVARMISNEYMNHIIDARRNGALSAEDLQMVRSIMNIVGLKFKGEVKPVYPMLETLVNTMTENLDKYPAYKNSDTYKVKIAPNYQNKKSDSTFFF